MPYVLCKGSLHLSTDPPPHQKEENGVSMPQTLVSKSIPERVNGFEDWLFSYFLGLRLSDVGDSQVT